MEECWVIITQIHIKIYSKDKYVGKFQKVNIITILLCKFTLIIMEFKNTNMLT